jgi:hypothetical protein
VKILWVLLPAVFATACHQSSLQNTDHSDDCTCQRDLAKLMSDQPGHVPPVFCDSSFVMHLEANK